MISLYPKQHFTQHLEPRWIPRQKKNTAGSMIQDFVKINALAFIRYTIKKHKLNAQGMFICPFVMFYLKAKDR